MVLNSFFVQANDFVSLGLHLRVREGLDEAGLSSWRAAVGACLRRGRSAVWCFAPGACFRGVTPGRSLFSKVVNVQMEHVFKVDC